MQTEKKQRKEYAKYVARLVKSFGEDRGTRGAVSFERWLELEGVTREAFKLLGWK